MDPHDPPTLKAAGVIVFPDVLLPWPIELLGLAGLAWLAFAPVLVAWAARRGSYRRASLAYATGVLLLVALMTVHSGLIGEPLVRRLAVWAEYIWAPVIGLAFLLGLTAVVLGRMSRRVWPRAPS